MLIQLGEIKSMAQPLGTLLEKDLPAKTSWRLGKLAKQIEKELQDIEEERVRLIKKYGTTSEDGEVKVSDENINAFIEEFSSILLEEVEINFTPMDIDLLGNCVFDGRSMALLEKLFVEKE